LISVQPVTEQITPAQVSVAPKIVEPRIISPKPVVQSPVVEKEKVVEAATTLTVEPAEESVEEATVEVPSIEKIEALITEEEVVPVRAVKKILPLTPQQKDQKVARQAREMIQAGKLSEAIVVLQQQLNSQPQSLYSGELLATLLLSQQRLTETAQLLDQLLAFSPKRVELMVIKARMYLQANENQQALTYLQSQKPTVIEHSAYYEILATAAQRSGDYVAAQKTYTTLLGLDGSRADWWFGLAVAFDAQADTNNALAAYQRALSQRGLGKNLKNYASQRISALAKGI
jgi:MSHA biogenesis protein MshN